MISILSAASWLRDNHYRLILQCQSKTPMLRQYLSEQGWQITAETVLRDGKFLYTIMEARWQPDAPRLTIGQCYFPPALLKEPTEALPAYFQWVRDGLRIACQHQKDPEKKRALDELEGLAFTPTTKFLTEGSL